MPGLPLPESEPLPLNGFLNQSDLPRAELSDLLLFVLRRRQHMRVDGFSMKPVLNAGDHVLIRTVNQNEDTPPCGSIVVSWHPQLEGMRIIKRLTGCQGGLMDLRGDNSAASTDSRQFGLVERSRLIGVVTAVLR